MRIIVLLFYLIGSTIFIIQLVSKFMENQVLSVVNVRCTFLNFIPGQHHIAVFPGLSAAVLKAFLHKKTVVPVFNLSYIGFRIYKHRAKAVIERGKIINTKY